MHIASGSTEVRTLREACGAEQIDGVTSSATAAELPDYGAFERGQRVHAAQQLHGVHNAALREVFRVVAEMDRRAEFSEDGARDAAAWLQLQFGLPRGVASTWAEVALALEELPHLAHAFASGELCLDKVAEAVKIATPETDAEVTEEAKRFSVGALARRRRRSRSVDPVSERRAYDERHLRWFWNHGRTRLSFEGELPTEDGERFISAIERIADSLPLTEDGELVKTQARRADALALLAATRIAEDQDPDRADVLITVGLEALRAELGKEADEALPAGEGEGGGIYSSEVIQRLICDARIQLLLQGEDGEPLGISSTSRNLPRWVRRALERRDEHTCRFPGCCARGFNEAHHIVLWTDGGPHRLENLILLCRFHHRLIHKAGWRIVGDPKVALSFIRPDGSVVAEGPVALEPATQQRFRDWVVGDARFAPSAEPRPRYGPAGAPMVRTDRGVEWGGELWVGEGMEPGGEEPRARGRPSKPEHPDDSWMPTFLDSS